jgi:hypothetical protein
MRFAAHNCSKRPGSNVGPRRLGFIAMTMTCFLTNPALAQLALTPAEKAIHQAAIALEKEIGLFLEKPEGTWFEDRKARIDVLVDGLAERARAVAKDPKGYESVSACEWAYYSLAGTVILARMTNWSHGPAAAAEHFDGDYMVYYLEQMQICDLIGGTHGRKPAFQSKAVKTFNCRETGQDCE